MHSLSSQDPQAALTKAYFTTPQQSVEFLRGVLCWLNKQMTQLGDLFGF